MDALRRRDFLVSMALATVPRQAAAAGAACRDLGQLLSQRRMVRRFRADPVGDDVVRRLLDTATRAPSAGHLQPWGFIVVRDPAKRRALGEAAVGQTWLADAPVSIVACADPARARPRYGARADRYAIVDTAFASLLLLLAVTDLGLGACFVGAFDDDRVRRIVAIPADVLPLAVIPIGHPAERPRAKTRRPIPSVVHEEAWR
jgi:nitroreductase